MPSIATDCHRLQPTATDCDSLVSTQADFAHYGFDSGANPRTEIIVRHENEWSREVDAGERGVCLDTRGVSIKTFSGWHGSQRCNCQPLRKAGYSFLNCA